MRVVTAGVDYGRILAQAEEADPILWGGGNSDTPFVRPDPPIVDTVARHPHIGAVLPAMGYGHEQIEELRQTIARSHADLVLSNHAPV